MTCIKVTSQTQWEAIADAYCASLPQRWIYGEAARRLGRDVQRFAFLQRSEPVGLAQFLTRRVAKMPFSLSSRCLLPHGTTHKEARKSLRDALPRGMRLMTPEHPTRGVPLSQRQARAIWTLSPSEEDMRAGLHQKWRAALKKSEAEPPKIAMPTANPQSLTSLLQAEKQRQAAGTYKGLPPEFALVLHEVAPKSLRLFTALDAQMLFVLHGNSATYLIGHIGEDARKGQMGNLLLWHAALYLRAQGVAQLDLGSIDTKSAPDLARFKTRTGALTHMIGRTVLL